MKTTYLTIVLLSLAMSPAGAQQIDGRDCWPAYKKLTQHVTAGVCREDSSRSDAKGQGKVSQSARGHESYANVKK